MRLLQVGPLDGRLQYRLIASNRFCSATIQRIKRIPPRQRGSRWVHGRGNCMALLDMEGNLWRPQ